MKNVTENELLSAYLDGELAAEEQAEVERLLAESQEARQLLDQLRTLGSTLRSMPQHKLDEDLSRRVLELAERQSIAVEPQYVQPAGKGWAATMRRFLTPRALAWSSLAVAVAVMLTVLDRGELRRGADKKIAMAPPEITLEREAGVAGGLATGDAPDHPGHRSAMPRPPDEVREDLDGIVEAEYPAKAKEEAREADEHRAEPSEGVMFGATGVAGAKRSDAPDHPASDALDHPGHRFALPRPPADRTAESLLRTKAGPSRKSGAAAAPPADAPVMEKLAEPSSSGMKRSAQNGMVTKPGDRGIRKSNDKMIKQQGGVLLVRCDVSPQAVKDQAFDKLLVSNHITWKKKDRTQTAALDVIYVEATPAQIETAISQLAAQPEQFLSVSVEPAPGEVSQQNLSRFNRSRGRQQSQPRLKQRAGSAQMKQSQVEQDQLRHPVTKCQTLFVLRVVDVKQD